MPCVWEHHARMIREARNHIYSKVTKNGHQQLIIAVKKQEVEVSKLMDDGSDELLTRRRICVTLLRQARDAVTASEKPSFTGLDIGTNNFHIPSTGPSKDAEKQGQQIDGLLTKLDDDERIELLKELQKDRDLAFALRLTQQWFIPGEIEVPLAFMNAIPPLPQGANAVDDTSPIDDYGKNKKGKNHLSVVKPTPCQILKRNQIREPRSSCFSRGTVVLRVTT
ncbi:hypothetical protein BT96DRAFT_944715 [Gymnopus androsaceus JB14]|uniref:Uncharacterized protein n=1 Tax=Gymnopus androsaceus JB14 TaxID=1447944 RepID=A0A6A4H3K2_9AGAR|nr:hypothetical protein BT96DRAFT_944715 [Gymnopus androsaceus JB14]